MVKSNIKQLYIKTKNKKNKAKQKTKQKEDFELRLASYRESYPILLLLQHMQNYTSYASFYLQVLKCFDKMYPGLKEILAPTGISVQDQDGYSLRTAIDMQGEKTPSCVVSTYLYSAFDCIFLSCLGQFG